MILAACCSEDGVVVDDTVAQQAPRSIRKIKKIIPLEFLVRLIIIHWINIR